MKGKGPLFISGVQALSLPDGDVDCCCCQAGYLDDSTRLTMKVQGQCCPAPTQRGPESERGRGWGNGDDYSLLRV